MAIKWDSSLEIGIPVIDSQHKRIVDYINKLEHAQSYHNREELGEVLDQLIDYTLSHFAFEEGLMEEAAYPFVKAHKKVHALFTKRVANFHQRFKMGDDVAKELSHTLQAWLVNHIKADDQDYSASVINNLEHATSAMKNNKPGLFARLFG